ncbi:peptidase domain-containing ABC transporter [Aquirufa aurantiipilula]|uniref:ATP-binding cassette domain-containing protein n=1 Tax=Aquirufa aurantiipilula TaxID=2696561 RepID=A0ABT6BKN1_9BACT|nr:ATP-binding cassette domain-containing protein [Aquirufa aurantiipilula]MBZ1326708.1 ATP-binding cassette domain-containing protein [Aquirufa aurantiipilula]MDF5690716.1 ATP-binding cassette domain-containing protein [Aquirufa aurantiipilula]
MIKKNPIDRISKLVSDHKKEVTSIYLFSIVSGLVNLSLPLGVQSIIGLVMGATMVTSIYILIFFIVLGVFLVGLLQINQMKIIEAIQQRIFAQYSFDFADKIPKMDLMKNDQYFIPEKVSRFFDIVNVQKGFAKLLLDIPMASVQILFGTILLSLYHPFFIVFSLALLIMLVFILYVTSQVGIQTSIEESNHKYGVASFFSEIGRTLKSFKFSQGFSLNIKKTDANVSQYLVARTKHFRVLLFQYKTLVTFKVVLTIITLSLGSYLLINQQLNLGEFIAAEIVILMVIGAVEKLITSLDSAYDVITGLEKIASVIESPMETSGQLDLSSKQGLEIELKELSFHFEAGNNILENLTLHIRPGDKVAILGTEGAGKSMLLRLLTGNYQRFQGSILINHIPIQNYNLASLRKQTGILLHGQEIFGGTVWENISLGQEDISPDVIMEAAKKLGFENFISHFPKGFEHIIEPIGKKTPQTIIKKILLLRAICGAKKLLLLEEPWNGLDQASAQRLKSYLLNPDNQATTIIVSNDPEYVSASNQQINL